MSSPEQLLERNNRISRRAALKKLGMGGLVATLNPLRFMRSLATPAPEAFPSAASVVPPVEIFATDPAVSPAILAEPKATHPAEQNPSSSLAEFVDTATAVPVTALFATYVTRGNFDAKTAYSMMLAEAGRLLLIGLVNPEAAKNEAEELIKSMAIATFVTGIAEIADRTRVSVKSLMEKNHLVRDATEALGRQNNHTNSELLNLQNASIEELETEQEINREEILRLVAGNAAVTQILAPMATTYASASASADLVRPLFWALFRAYSAQIALEYKRKGQEFDETEVRQKAIDAALDRINGPTGYINMSITGSSNIAGSLGIGDLPLVFRLVRQLKLFGGQKDVAEALSEHITTLSKEGAVYSALSHIGINEYWMMSTGLFPKDIKTQLHSANKFREYFSDSLITLTTSPFYEKVRDAMWLGNREYSRQVHQLILEFQNNDPQSADANLRHLKGLLLSIPHPLVEFDVTDCFGDLLYSLGKLNQFAQETPQRLIALLKSGDLIPELATLDEARRMKTQIPEDQSRQLSNLLLEVLQSKPGPVAKTTDSPFDGPAEDLVRQFQNHLVEGDEGLEENLVGFNSLVGALGSLNPSYAQVQTAVNTALDAFRGIKPRESEGSKSLFGTTSRDVFWTLFTQLTGVPAAVRLATVTLKGALGLQNNQDIPDWKRIAATYSTLELTEKNSGVQDNSAAYLFGSDTLSQIYQAIYGLKYLQNTALKNYADLAALFAAVFGGALTRIGNGPNLVFRMLKALLVANAEKDEIVLSEEPLPFWDSAKNPYAHVAGEALIWWLVYKGEKLQAENLAA